MRFAAYLFVLSCAAGAVNANENVQLTLSAIEIQRLGIVLASAEAADAVVLATGPAELVIPPAQQSIVAAPVSGLISRLLVAEGEAVRAGQALVEIQSAELLDLQRMLIEARSADELARAQLERDRGLRADGIIADKRLQETQAAAHAAAVALDQARQRLTLAGQTGAELAALAERRLLSTTLTVRAPFDGTVVARLADLGARVETLTSLCRIADLTTLWLEVHVPQERATRLRVGHVAVVTLHERAIEAVVTHVGQTVDPASQTVLVRAVVDNRALDLRPGQFLPARILARADADAVPALTIPTAAVVRDGGRAFVFARIADGFAIRTIELVSDDGTRAYVTTGLEQREQIAVSGVAALKAIWLESRVTEEAP
jgi:cobalt-zinc-cadmium efflux system membrane fusion protein